jgi:hypothetical protein
MLVSDVLAVAVSLVSDGAWGVWVFGSITG